MILAICTGCAPYIQDKIHSLPMVPRNFSRNSPQYENKFRFPPRHHTVKLHSDRLIYHFVSFSIVSTGFVMLGVLSSNGSKVNAGWGEVE